MAVKLIVEPRAVYSWDEFRKKPPFSIALDGLVNDAPQRDPSGPYANFDHHSHCDRLATRATCEQVHMEINMGLFNTFRQNGIPTANIYVNDCDEDTCLSIWLLMHHERVTGHGEPAINRLVYYEDRLDATAGSYPFGDTETRRKMAWIFEPYTKQRYEGKVAGMNSQEMRAVIENVLARISTFTLDGSEQVGLDGSYEIIGGGRSWKFIQETGPFARIAMFVDKIDAFAVFLGKREKRYRYVIGRRSVWIPFNLELIYERLNEADKEVVTENNRWSGSNTIGGSPRMTGSTLKPKEVERIIDDTVSKK